MHPAEQHVWELVHRQGRISFARFMETALFSPRGGYYTSPKHLEDRGDYFTSPAAHPLFGALLAIQLEQMWELLDRPPRFTVVEPGAGSGQLGRDIVHFSAALTPGFASALRYVALDRFAPSPAAQGASAQPLVSAGIPLRGLVGCILSNELVDSFPVHRFQVQEGRVRELFVTLQDSQLAETLDEPSTPELARRLGPFVDSLPDGFRGEVNLALEPWMAEAAGALERGFVLTVDYGGVAEELYAPRRRRGTIQCYYRHTVSDDPYLRVGRQDITAHVDFTALEAAGRRHGLATLGFTGQAEFLITLGALAFQDALARRAHGEGEDGQRARGSGGGEHKRGTSGGRGEYKKLGQSVYMTNRMGMEELLRPQGLGGFRVLAQGRGVGSSRLWGFWPDNPRRQELLERISGMEPPLRGPEHAPLLEGRYPHQALAGEVLGPWDTPPGG
jgi:SAM-dependent MidA family methyltransferase